MRTVKGIYFNVSLLALALYCLPWVMLGENSYILIHDNLDSNIVWFKVLAESGMIFAKNSEIIHSFMSAPRGAFGSEFNLILWLYYFFEPYTAYVTNQILIRIIAFLGMLLLLNRYVLDEENKKYSALISLLYSILPFWPTGGLSVAGLPLITYVLFNIRAGNYTKKDWIILFLFPLYSSFILSMMFYIILAGALWFYDVVKSQVTKRFTLAIFTLGALYLIVEYRLVLTFILGSDFISHRTEFSATYYGVTAAIKAAKNHFIYGQYHAHSLHRIFLPFVVVAVILNIFTKNKDWLLIGLFVLNIALSIWYGFWGYDGWKFIRESSSILNSINLSRFHFITPLIWYVLLALSIKNIYIKIIEKYKEFVIFALIGLSALSISYRSDFINEYKGSRITFSEFYAEDLFSQIDHFIGKEKSTYKVLSLGFHPTISSYNDFYTLDGYLANYDINYKHQFRAIISKELDEDNQLKNYFDGWGSRCYVFAGAIGTNFTRSKNSTYPINISINSNAAYDMGARYILSSYKLENPNENNLSFLSKFESEHSAWDIYLYEIAVHPPTQIHN